jgi:hypothetical protein
MGTALPQGQKNRTEVEMFNEEDAPFRVDEAEMSEMPPRRWATKATRNVAGKTTRPQDHKTRGEDGDGQTA